MWHTSEKKTSLLYFLAIIASTAVLASFYINQETKWHPELKINTIEEHSGFPFGLLLFSISVLSILSLYLLKNHSKRVLETKGFITKQKLSCQHASSLMEACLDPLVTINPEGKITDINTAMATITGRERLQLIGSDFVDYFIEPQKVSAIYQEVLTKGSVTDASLTFCHKEGKQTNVLCNASTYKDDEGNVAGMVVIARNTDEQKWATELRIANEELRFQNNEKEKRAAELMIANKELLFQTSEKEKRAAELVIADIELIFQNKEKEKREIANQELKVFSNSLKLASQYSLSLIEASRDPLFTISPEGKITDTNEASVQVTGVAREQLIGSDFFDYFTEPDKAREGYEQVFAKGFIADYPLTIMDGKLRDVLLNGSVYKDEDGKVLGVVVVARDITDQKRIEKELIEAKVFAELATSLAEEAKIKAESATQIAENAVKSKQQFLSNMSHEIRTPMNAIIGFTKVALKTNLSAKQKEYLMAIKMSGDALIVLINDILDLAKVDAGKMTFELIPFKMAASISAMLHLFGTKIQEKNLILETDYDSKIPDTLIGDPVRLHQIILNLVSNAVKFTSNGKITVRVRLIDEDHENATVQFSVTDTGIGMNPEQMETIFDNFQQASSGTSRLYGGTGLGLAIVKQLVEPQGGSIDVVSKIEEGSTFSFILPFKKTNVVATIVTEIIELDTIVKNMKVLVVEDMPLNQLLMKTLLDDFGFECDIAGNGRLALEKLKENAYDIILMDLQMPEMNGFEATQYIRKTMNSKIPIIALTADVTTVDLAKCKAVGMDDYIAKPVDERLLYSKLVGLVKPKTDEAVLDTIADSTILKYINLKYLNELTKSNPRLMEQMIQLYLDQTPTLISTMKKSFEDKDWHMLHASVHKMIPSFAIIGISNDFENMAKKIQEYARNQEQTANVYDIILTLEEVCTKACHELQEELNLLKNI